MENIPGKSGVIVFNSLIEPSVGQNISSPDDASITGSMTNPIPSPSAVSAEFRDYYQLAGTKTSTGSRSDLSVAERFLRISLEVIKRNPEFDPIALLEQSFRQRGRAFEPTIPSEVTAPITSIKSEGDVRSFESPYKTVVAYIPEPAVEIPAPEEMLNRFLSSVYGLNNNRQTTERPTDVDAKSLRLSPGSHHKSVDEASSSIAQMNGSHKLESVNTVKGRFRIVEVSLVQAPQVEAGGMNDQSAFEQFKTPFLLDKAA